METDNFLKQFNEEMEKICQETEHQAAEAVEAPPPEQRGLVPIEALRAKVEAEVEEGFHKMQAASVAGYLAIFTALEEMGTPNCQELVDWCDENGEALACFYKLPPPEEGHIQVPEAYIDWMFQAVSYLHSKKKFDEAENAIGVLVSLSPFLYKHWYLYGTILQEKNTHDEALFAFQMAAALNEKDPYPLAAMARSWISLGGFDDAKECNDKALALCKNLQGCDELIAYCDTLSAFIKKNKVEKK